MWYIQNLSLKLDLIIIGKTLLQLIKGDKLAY